MGHKSSLVQQHQNRGWSGLFVIGLMGMAACAFLSSDRRVARVVAGSEQALVPPVAKVADRGFTGRHNRSAAMKPVPDGVPVLLHSAEAEAAAAPVLVYSNATPAESYRPAGNAAAGFWLADDIGACA